MKVGEQSLGEIFDETKGFAIEAFACSIAGKSTNWPREAAEGKAEPSATTANDLVNAASEARDNINGVFTGLAKLYKIMEQIEKAVEQDNDEH